MMRCQICGDELSDNFYKNEDDEIICEECLLETTSKITNYFVDGEFIGNNSESIQDVVDQVCEIFGYEKVEED